MSKRIEYQPGSIVGECEFIMELTKVKRNDTKGYERRAKFKCLYCGNVFDAYLQNVKRKYTTSCGCNHVKIMKSILTTHGLTGNPIFDVYRSIMSRCYGRKTKNYINYGGRGIAVYEPWINDPTSFIDYVIKLPRYGEPGMTIDRYPDNNGNYEPGNVRWATRHEQSVNTRINKNNRSGYTGVYYRKNRMRYVACIVVNRHRKYITHSAKTPLEAATARDWYIIKNGLWEYPLQVIRTTK